MSKSQELFGLLKGLQIVVRASLRTNEEYARHVWANSSVREILEENLKGGKAKEVLSNPGKQVEEAFGLVRETLERSSVVVEGIYLFICAIIKIFKQYKNIFLYKYYKY